MDRHLSSWRQPVFYDPRKARWKRIRLAFDVIGVSITLLVIFFAYTALRNEPLPELLLAPQKKPYRALKEKEREKAKERRKLAAVLRGHRKSRSAPSQVKLNQEEGIRAAFYVPYDAASFSSLREYARQIDLLFPGLAARHHARRPAAGHRRTDQQVLRRDAGLDRPPRGRQGHAVSEVGRHRHGSLPHGQQLRRDRLGGRQRLPE